MAIEEFHSSPPALLKQRASAWRRERGGGGGGGGDALMAWATVVGCPSGPPAYRGSNVERSRGGLRLQVSCRKRERERERDHHNHERHPYKVVEITPPPTDLGVRCFPPNMHCGESVTIEGQAYTVSAVIHRYQLRKGKYESREKRLDVQSTGRYILNLYLEELLQKS